MAPVSAVTGRPADRPARNSRYVQTFAFDIPRDQIFWSFFSPQREASRSFCTDLPAWYVSPIFITVSTKPHHWPPIHNRFNKLQYIKSRLRFLKKHIFRGVYKAAKRNPTVSWRHVLVSNFRRVLNAVCFLLGDSPAYGFYTPTFRNTLFHLHRQVGVKGDRIWEKSWSIYTGKDLARI